MAEPKKIINNPSITSGSFTIDDGKIVAIAGMPLAGSGGGTQSDFVYVPSFNSETGDITFNLGVTGTEGKGPWHISGTPGPKGEDGVQGQPGEDACPITAVSAGLADGVHVTISYTSGGNALTEFDIYDGYDGKDGKTPEFSANPVNAHLLWKYSDDSNWTDFGFAMSGEKGPQGETGPRGLSGANGKDGINGTSAFVRINQSTNYWEISNDNATWISTNVSATGPQGEEGDDGEPGFSPTVDAVAITDGEKTGTKITFTYKDAQGQTQTTVYSAWNGVNGEGATVHFTGVDGIEITPVNTTHFNVGLSADYKTQVEAVSGKLDANALDGYATQSWVEDKHYLVANDIAGKADKTDLQYVSAGVDYVSAHIPSLNGYATEQYVQGASAGVTAWVNNQGYLKSVPAGYATETWVNNQGFLTEIPNTYALKTDIPTTVAELTDSGNYYKKTETSAASALATEFAKYVIKPTSLVDKYLVLRTDGSGNVSGWYDLQAQSYSKSEANETFVATANIDTTTLSGNGKSVSTKLGVKTDVIPTKDWLDDNYLPLSGGTVSGSTYFSAANGQNMLAVASAATLIGASRQTSGHFGQDTNALGTTWIGVGGPGMYRGFLKYTQDGNVGDLDSNNTMQVEFTPNNKGTIFAKAKNSGNDCPETQILNPTKASCDAMATSANANLVSGPNYMLAKNADGQFVIGAACINCTAISDVTLSANTYYFVYEV